jgi:hypothetical protein
VLVSLRRKAVVMLLPSTGLLFIGSGRVGSLNSFALSRVSLEKDEEYTSHIVIPAIYETVQPIDRTVVAVGIQENTRIRQLDEYLLL